MTAPEKAAIVVNLTEFRCPHCGFRTLRINRTRRFMCANHDCAARLLLDETGIVDYPGECSDFGKPIQYNTRVQKAIQEGDWSQ